MDQAGADKQWVRGPFSAANRAARAIRVILSKVFKLVVTNFFDDFCQLELGSLRQSAWTTAETVMNLLGWSISAGDDKRRPFFFSVQRQMALARSFIKPERQLHFANSPN